MDARFKPGHDAENGVRQKDTKLHSHNGMLYYPAKPGQPAGDAENAAGASHGGIRLFPANSPVIFGIDIASMLLGGLAAGMVLFIVSVGLSVTMGLMGFVNLAHGGFAMIGGYVIVLAMNRLGMPFVAGAGVRLHRHRRGQRGVRAAALLAALPRRRARPGAVHHRPGVHR